MRIVGRNGAAIAINGTTNFALWRILVPKFVTPRLNAAKQIKVIVNIAKISGRVLMSFL